MPVDNLQTHTKLRADAHSAISYIDSLLQSDWCSYDVIITKLVNAESVEKTSFTLKTIQNHFKKIKEMACDKNFISDNFEEYIMKKMVVMILLTREGWVGKKSLNM